MYIYLKLKWIFCCYNLKIFINLYIFVNLNIFKKLIVLKLKFLWFVYKIILYRRVIFKEGSLILFFLS